MSISEYYGVLSRALHELKLELGNNDDAWAWEMITEESGVYNVKDIAEGVIKPTIESWQQLHKSFPDKIPPPQMPEGEGMGDKSVSCSGSQVAF